MLLTLELIKARGLEGEKLALFIHKYGYAGMLLTPSNMAESNIHGVIPITWLLEKLLTAEERSELAAAYADPLYYYSEIQEAEECILQIRNWTGDHSCVPLSTISDLGEAARAASQFEYAEINTPVPNIALAKRLSAFAIGTAGYIIGNQSASDHSVKLYELMAYARTARSMYEGKPIGHENRYRENQLIMLAEKIENSPLSAT